jgi:ubiquinone/menaquinone biosynthesis C-methylase UbiE
MVDISKYAIKNAHPDIKNFNNISNANKLKWKDNYFDLVVSFNTLHNLT